VFIQSRKPGEWLTIVHNLSGDVLRVRVRRTCHDGRVDLAFDDLGGRRFEIRRSEELTSSVSSCR
jgi:hypothetical protein